MMQALGDKSGHLYLDKLSHASLIDGAIDSKAKVKRFLHNDTQQLERILAKEQAKLDTKLNNVIVSEGVFSMDGDQANVAQLSAIAG